MNYPHRLNKAGRCKWEDKTGCKCHSCNGCSTHHHNRMLIERRSDELDALVTRLQKNNEELEFQLRATRHLLKHALERNEELYAERNVQRDKDAERNARDVEQPKSDTEPVAGLTLFNRLEIR